MPDEFDPWQTGTGLKTNYDGTVLDAWFATDSRYNDGRTTLLWWKVQADDEPEPHEEGWPCGGDWMSYDGGQTIEHPKGTEHKINKQSAYGHLIDRVAELGDEPMKVLRDRGRPTIANVWIGTRWHVETEERKFKIGGEERTTSRNYPTAFLGVTEVESAPVGNEFASPQTVDNPGDSLSGTVTDDLPPEVMAKLKVLAQTNPYEVWVDKVLDSLTQEEMSDRLVKALGDESFYATLT